jgi:ABC-type sugar transport system ATPase subunit
VFRGLSRSGALSTPREDRTSPRVELRAISKRFHGVSALADVSLEVTPGSVHGLVGENGAGKSTLMKITGGVIRPDSGDLLVDGAAVSYRSPRDALADGITIIAQEISLVPARSVIENVFLGTEPTRGGFVDTDKLHTRFLALCERVGFELDPTEQVRLLRLADQQKVEILRALARDASFIIMDEPTASLTTDEAQRLLATVRRLRDGGTSVVYVSHFLQEVLDIADTVTVLKDGQLVRTAPADGESQESLVRAMLGRPLASAFPPKRPPAETAPVVLECRGLARGHAVQDVSLTVRAGEILGLAGLIGSGRSEVARLIFGLDRAETGTVSVNGQPAHIRHARHAMNLGLRMVPESRKDQGLVMGRSSVENVTLAYLRDLSTGPLISLSRERSRASGVLSDLDVRGETSSAPVSTLSGGNQQKVVFAKALFQAPTLLIADEPTRGVDVGAKESIYKILVDLAAQGLAIVLISSDLEEVLGLAHRVAVMRNGRLVAEFPGDVADAEVMSAAFGTKAAR